MEEGGEVGLKEGLAGGAVLWPVEETKEEVLIPGVEEGARSRNEGSGSEGHKRIEEETRRHCEGTVLLDRLFSAVT